MPSNEENKIGENMDGYDIDAVAELSSEEIERLLAEGADSGFPDSPAEQNVQGDVLDLPQDDGDDDLWEIQDMLKKSDRDEAIEESPQNGPSQEESPADRLLADIEAGGEEEPAEEKDSKVGKRERKAQEKARKAQEKLRLKEEKAQKREAARAEKAKKRGQKKRGGEEAPMEPAQKDSEGIEEYDLLLDKELLDSIVSDAENAGHEESEREKRKSPGFSVNKLGEEYDAAKERERAIEAEEMERRRAPEREEIMDSGILEVDMDEVDALVPDITKEEPKEEQGKKGKGSFVSKIITMLTEEVEEPENEDMPISEENQEILRDLDGEKAAGGKAKKPKKAKKPPKKKEKKEKKQKAPKPKKPKKPKAEKDNEPVKKIGFKKSLPILLLGASVGAAVFIFVNLATDFSAKQAAATAFRNEDYAACYQGLHGKKLSEDQAKMYGKSESILYMEQMLRKYDIFLKQGTEVQAVDCLIQTVHDYPAVCEYAAQWDALPEVYEIYSGVLGILSDKYGVTEQKAQEIAALKSNIEYTRAVTAVAEGKGYGADEPQGEPESDQEDIQGGTAEGGQEDIQGGTAEGDQDGTAEGDQEDPSGGTLEEQPLPDQLPEESELGQENFADNE